MITIGSLAKAYGLLPSEVMARATTFDLMVADVMATWEDHRNNPDKLDNYKVEDLEELVKKAR